MNIVLTLETVNRQNMRIEQRQALCTQVLVEVVDRSFHTDKEHIMLNRWWRVLRISVSIRSQKRMVKELQSMYPEKRFEIISRDVEEDLWPGKLLPYGGTSETVK